jgi:hypothetical protein
MTGLQPFSFGLTLPIMLAHTHMLIVPFTVSPALASYYASTAVAPLPPPAMVPAPQSFLSDPVLELLPPAPLGEVVVAPDHGSATDALARPFHLTHLITTRLSLDNYLL